MSRTVMSPSNPPPHHSSPPTTSMIASPLSATRATFRYSRAASDRACTVMLGTWDALVCGCGGSLHGPFPLEKQPPCTVFQAPLDTVLPCSTILVLPPTDAFARSFSVLQGGHYIAYVRARDGLWYLCDDALISRVSEDAVRGAQAYMLFYGHARTLGALHEREFA